MTKASDGLPDEDAMFVEDIEQQDGPASNVGPFQISRGNEIDSTKPVRLPFDQWLEALLITDNYKKELDPSKIEVEASKESDDSDDNSEGGSSQPGNEAAVEHVRIGIAQSRHLGLLCRFQLCTIVLDLQRILHTAAEGANRLARVFGSPQTPPPAMASLGTGGASSPEVKMRRLYTCPLDQVSKELEDKYGLQSGVAFSRLFTDQEGQELVFSADFHNVMKMFGQSVFKVSRNQDQPPSGKTLYAVRLDHKCECSISDIFQFRTRGFRSRCGSHVRLQFTAQFTLVSMMGKLPSWTWPRCPLGIGIASLLSSDTAA